VRRISRRNFITDLGRGTVGVVILGAAVIACSDDDAAPSASSTSNNDDTASSSTLEWQQVSFSSVSAYVLARGTEVAIVDTGTGAIGTRFDDAFTALLLLIPHEADHPAIVFIHAIGRGRKDGLATQASGTIGIVLARFIDEIVLDDAVEA